MPTDAPSNSRARNRSSRSRSGNPFVYLARTVEFDDAYHLNFAGRAGEDTGALDTSNPLTHR